MFKAIIFSILFLLPATTMAEKTPCKSKDCVVQEEGSHDFGITIIPMVTPADAYEFVERIYAQVNEAGSVEVCVLELGMREYPSDWFVPVDDDGYLMVLDVDGMTFLPLEEIVDEINTETCTLDEYSGT